MKTWFAASVAALGIAVAGIASAQVPSVGLSTVRSQRFVEDKLLGFYGPRDGDRFGFAVATGDFNGDGVDDLATGIPHDDGLIDAPIDDSGSVVVRYGIPEIGLASSLASTVLRQVPYMNPPEAGDQLGYSLASCDFNDDGFDDLAVGVPLEDHVGREEAGAVQVHYGGPSGLNFTPEGFFAQSSPGIPGDAEERDLFGLVLACGDFDADGFGDLAIGSPQETQEGIFLGELFSGMVVIVPGSAIGLYLPSSTYLTQAVDGVGGDAESFDFFSFGLGVGDFNGDGFDDLAVGSPGEDELRGALHAFFGTPEGITPIGSLFWMETFVGGTSADGDHFGWSFASDDFDRDGFDDLAVGIPHDDLLSGGEAIDVGRVAVLYGSRLGFDRGRTQFWSEDEILGPASSETDDHFGATLVTGDFDKDGFADLVIDHPGETLAGPANGAVTVLMGSSAGLTDARTREIASGIDGFPGPTNQPARSLLGGGVAAGDFDGDGHADLVIGAPEEEVGGNLHVGAETVLYGAIFADGVDNGDASFWSAVHSSSAANRVAVTKEARLGPASSGKFGLEFVVAEGTPRAPAISFVRVDPDRGLRNERTLRGTFFIDPQNLTMSTTAGVNSFRFMSFDDGPSPAGKTRLALNLVRAGSTYALAAEAYDNVVGALRPAGLAVLAAASGVERNLRIDFEWRAGAPGHLTMWRTAAPPQGFPDPAFKVQMFSVDLPNAAGVVNHITAGVVSGVDLGTVGSLYLDELSFRR